MFLTPDELETLTGRSKPNAQIEQLTRMGVAYKVNALGKVIVLRSNLEQNWETAKRSKAVEPNWTEVR